jgi:hypothetical protein
MVGKPLPQVEDLPIDEAVEKLEARANSAKDMKTSTARLVWATWVLAGATDALVLSTVALIIVTANK